MRAARKHRARSRAAFTLLEVMAAVVIFAMVYVTLLRAVASGLILEGDAQRRLEASLLADRALAEAAVKIREDGATRPGEESEDNEIFQIATRIGPLDPAALGLDLTPKDEDGASRRPGGSSTRIGPSLLTPSGGAGNMALVDLEVIVSWQEGVETQSVQRKTFVFSAEAAAPLLEGIAASSELSPDSERDELPDQPDPNLLPNRPGSPGP